MLLPHPYLSDVISGTPLTGKGAALLVVGAERGRLISERSSP